MDYLLSYLWDFVSITPVIPHLQYRLCGVFCRIVGTLISYMCAALWHLCILGTINNHTFVFSPHKNNRERGKYLPFIYFFFLCPPG